MVPGRIRILPLRATRHAARLYLRPEWPHDRRKLPPSLIRLSLLLQLTHPFLLPQLHNSTDTQVVLTNVSLKATGRYRCEVSAEAPSFQTVSDHGDMIVVGECPPQIDSPRIRGQPKEHGRATLLL